MVPAEPVPEPPVPVAPPGLNRSARTGLRLAPFVWDGAGWAAGRKLGVGDSVTVTAGRGPSGSVAGTPAGGW